MSSSAADREYMTRRQLVEFLTDRGFPISQSTLNKLAMVSRGEGPPLAGVWSGRAYYDPVRALAWARSRFRTTKLTKGQRGAGRDC